MFHVEHFEGQSVPRGTLARKQNDELSVPRGTLRDMNRQSETNVPCGTLGGFPTSTLWKAWALAPLTMCDSRGMSFWVRCTEICHCQVQSLTPMLQATLRFSKN